MGQHLESEDQSIKGHRSEFDQFIYVLTHDFRAAFRSIHSLSQWIRADLETLLKPETKQYFDLLQDRVRSLDSVLGDLHDYSKAGLEPEQPERINIDELMCEIVQEINVPETCRIEKETFPEMYADRSKIKRIFKEILLRAKFHIPDENGIICVSFSSSESEYRFEIRDNGLPVSREEENTMFVPLPSIRQLKQNEPSRCGLASAKKIIESIGGRIETHRTEPSSLAIIVTFKNSDHSEVKP